ncbi:hypothetical protein DICSQDRAFT_101936 [Dichomitus squalens LYAD-421 SS1]|uniref:Rhodopsin domain-containing protein n=1 Tax=Dichomitus squalens TaxID=114155 RepID=A0A4V2K8S7_9APHY|nr:uncharacterized protein DICSQDRAFT_101936 [Dichomitus squalens LYAD-421 SS1]EJF63843.1 hypothetical protein DICSQDRAFT_101936 [Dichomitus squalens LYAD-421 SS1]TBU61108.1 hypothetical protein BD310DRAFT_813948 [Dichomitus squalens]
MTSFIVTIRILATLLPALGIMFTSLRLYYRWSRHHFGWDDGWAAFAIVCAFFLTAGAWTRSDTPKTGPFHHGHHVRIIGYYMLNVAFTCVLWASRLSILCSIIRLIPYMMRLRNYAHVFSALFGIMWAALIIIKIVVCETDTAWKKTAGVQCVLGPAVAGIELATDFIADLILVVLPIRLLWRIKLSTARRALLTGIFSASMFTTVVSIVHGVYVISRNRNAEGIWAHILASTAMIVCNLAVLVTWAMRAIGHRDDSELYSSNRIQGDPRSDASRAKDLTTLRFNHGTHPIVLQSLDRKDDGTTAVNSIAGSHAGSEESLAPMTFAGNTDKPIMTKADQAAYPQANPQR